MFWSCKGNSRLWQRFGLPPIPVQLKLTAGSVPLKQLSCRPFRNLREFSIAFPVYQYQCQAMNQGCKRDSAVWDWDFWFLVWDWTETMTLPNFVDYKTRPRPLITSPRRFKPDDKTQYDSHIPNTAAKTCENTD